ncbi:hypothetical protein DYH09_34790 [bacterium CPR1]|nr:hypothetical protein [bacterium CPR1]
MTPIPLVGLAGFRTGGRLLAKNVTRCNFSLSEDMLSLDLELQRKRYGSEKERSWSCLPAPFSGTDVQRSVPCGGWCSCGLLLKKGHTPVFESIRQAYPIVFVPLLP